MGDVYEKLFRHVLFPLYESGLRRRKTLQYLARYEASQWLSVDEVAALQWRKLQALLAHCYAHVPYYRKQWQRLDIHPKDIRNLGDYAQLPVLSKADIRTNFEDLKAQPLRDALLYKATGGSSGEPLRFAYTRDSDARRNAVMWRGYGWAGARMGRRTLLLWGGAVGDSSRGQRLKEHLFHAAFGRRVVNSFAMTEANMARYADAIDACKPDVIVAYVTPLVRLAQWLLANKRTPFRPQSILGAAEALHDSQREIIEAAFGCPAYNTYGCREFMLIASECEQRDGLHVNADHLLLEMARPHSAADGTDIGEVTITDLHNLGMPFIRYANGDLATPMAGACACGRGLPRLAKVQGRTLDALRTPQGHILPGEFFPHLLKDVPGLQQFQVVQRSLEHIDLSIVRGAGFEASGLAYIRREVAKVLGDSVELRIDFVEHIAPEANGKFRVTRSELT